MSRLYGEITAKLGKGLRCLFLRVLEGFECGGRDLCMLGALTGNGGYVEALVNILKDLCDFGVHEGVGLRVALGGRLLLGGLLWLLGDSLVVTFQVDGLGVRCPKVAGFDERF